MAAELHFTGQIAPDLALGGDVTAQAHSVLSRLTAALAERGLAPNDLLRLRLFVRDLNTLPAIEGAIDAHLGPQRPAVSVVELPAGALEPGVAVILDAVAAPDARTSRRLRADSVRFGPWVFLGAIAADEPRAMFASIEERLREQGARPRDVVKVGGWLTFPMRDYGPLGEARSALVGEAGLLPASAAVQVGRVSSDNERLAFEAIAFAPEGRGSDAGSTDTGGSDTSGSDTSGSDTSGEDPGKRGAEDQGTDGDSSTHEATSRLADFYLDARAAGGYVFTSGEVPDGRGSLAEQAREIYERLRAHLAAHDATPADVLQQTVFVRAGEDGQCGDKSAGGASNNSSATVTDAARDFYGADANLPPTTLLPVADFGFRPGCDVEIELVAATDARPTDRR